MIEVKNKDKIIDYLASKGHITLNIRGVIKNTNKRVFTDDQDSPNGVFIRDNYMNFIYAENEAFVQAFDQFIDEETFVGFSGTNRVVRDYYFKNDLVQWDNPCHQMHFEGKPFESVIPLESLVGSDADFVNEHYEYQNENSLTQIQEAIDCRPTSGLRLKDQLVSYVLLHQDDSIGYMYTLPEYRGRGYAYELTKDIVNKTLSSGRLPYIQIVYGNDKSIGLAKKAGFVDHGDVYWFGIVRTSGKDMQDMIQQYEAYFQQSARAFTCKETCMRFGVSKDIEVTEDGFIFEGILYPATWHVKDGVYYIQADIAQEVLMSGAVALMEEEWHVAIVNQVIQHPAYKALKTLD